MNSFPAHGASDLHLTCNMRPMLRESGEIVSIEGEGVLSPEQMVQLLAETGHLVFGTLHTTTAASTVDRLIDQFPADRQAQIRTMLASSLKGVVAQVLCKRVPKGRAAALEVLLVNSAIQSMIREGKTFQIPSAMQVGGKLGMRLMNDALMDLVTRKIIEPQEAFARCVDKQDMATKLPGLAGGTARNGASGEPVLKAA